MKSKIYGTLFALIISFFHLSASMIQAEEHTASFIPWSGYWWPFTDGGLATGDDYRGNPSPLEKYELLVRGTESGPSVLWYMENYYDPNAPNWYGLCIDWAKSACYEQYEIFPSSTDNLVFRVGDKKGLLTLAHTNDIAEWGDGSKPEVFHYWLLHYIKDQKKAFVADLDAGLEIWSYPIYYYKMQSEKVSADRESVKVLIFYATDQVEPDFMGTEIRWNVYTYDLFLNSDGEITGGEWTGSSVYEHPEMMAFPLTPQSRCPYLDYETVVNLARSKDDFLENGDQPVSLNPGTYHLVLMDEDSYMPYCAGGDTVSLQVLKESGSSEMMTVDVSDANGVISRHQISDSSKPLNLTVSVQYPPIRLSLSQADYRDPNIYSIKFDLKKAFQKRIPFISKDGRWSGFALTNAGETQIGGVMLVSYTSDGEPLQTLKGPMQLAPGEKKTFFFKELPLRIRELPLTDSLCLMADNQAWLVNLFETDNGALAGFTSQKQVTGGHLIIPDTAAPMAVGRSVYAGIAQTQGEPSPVVFRVYNKNGVPASERSETVGRGNFYINPGEYPFYSLPDDGWIEMLSEHTVALSAYQYRSSENQAECLFALPVSSSVKYVPHIPPPGYWTTTLTLINTESESNHLTFHLKRAQEDQTEDWIITLQPKEKQEIDIGQRFGKQPGEALYHSVLEIRGDRPFAGYYSYQTVENRDKASFPLHDDSDLKTELILPHYASPQTGWWTGIDVFNPLSVHQNVAVEPYNYDGILMTDKAALLTLAPGAYEVMPVDLLASGQDNEISFLKIRTEEPFGLIGGFFLYGDILTNSTYLCGSAM